MEIYVVQPGDTIDSIAQKFGISAGKLINDNGMTMPYFLVVGQTLVIAHPQVVYTVKEGDTLGSIAEAYGIPVMQLLRNNPFLASRQYIYTGETLVISYDNNDGTLITVGYTYPFIRDEILRMTLPNLTYVPVFNYRMTGEGDIIGEDEDLEVIQIAKLYDAAPTMVLTAYSKTGEIDLEVVYSLLTNKEVQDKLLDNLLLILKEKGYYGVNLAFQFVNTDNQQLYIDFLTNVTNRLHPEGYTVFITLNPGLSYNGNEVTFEKLDYSFFGNNADGILFLSYDWGTIERPPIPYSIITTSTLLDYIVAQVPLDKIRILMPTLGYDWQLPYEPGKSKANALVYESVLRLANQMDAVIQYDENMQSAYFEYVDNTNLRHIVWFKDARSIDSSLQILKSYGINGIGIWNILYYFAQMWLVINTQYQIVKLTDL